MTDKERLFRTINPEASCNNCEHRFQDYPKYSGIAKDWHSEVGGIMFHSWCKKYNNGSKWDNISIPLKQQQVTKLFLCPQWKEK